MFQRQLHNAGLSLVCGEMQLVAVAQQVCGRGRCLRCLHGNRAAFDTDIDTVVIQIDRKRGTGHPNPHVTGVDVEGAVGIVGHREKGLATQ